MISIKIRIGKWIKPRYGLKASDYQIKDIGKVVIWYNGAEHEILKVDLKKNRVKIRRI